MSSPRKTRSPLSTSRTFRGTHTHCTYRQRGTVVSWGSRYTKRVWMATAAAVLPLSALPTVLQRVLDDGDEFLVLDSVDRIKDTRHGHQKANGSIFADLCNGLYNSEQFSVDIFVIRQMIGTALDSGSLYTIFLEGRVIDLPTEITGMQATPSSPMFIRLGRMLWRSLAQIYVALDFIMPCNDNDRDYGFV